MMVTVRWVSASPTSVRGGGALRISCEATAERVEEFVRFVGCEHDGD